VSRDCKRLFHGLLYPRSLGVSFIPFDKVVLADC
jgi:hypothetical protein